jgi:hypothetical protein
MVVDVKKDKIEEVAYALLEHDLDLTENEDYFQEDTLELGYDSEADRIIKESIKRIGKPTSVKEYKAILRDVWSKIEGQEYFGGTNYEFIDIGSCKFSVVFMYGGHIE